MSPCSCQPDAPRFQVASSGCSAALLFPFSLPRGVQALACRRRDRTNALHLFVTLAGNMGPIEYWFHEMAVIQTHVVDDHLPSPLFAHSLNITPSHKITGYFEKRLANRPWKATFFRIIQTSAAHPPKGAAIPNFLRARVGAAGQGASAGAVGFLTSEVGTDLGGLTSHQRAPPETAPEPAGGCLTAMRDPHPW